MPVGLPVTLHKGVGRSFMATGDGKADYDRPSKKRPARTQGNLPGRLVGCVPSVPLRKGSVQDVAGLALPHAAPTVEANRSLGITGGI